MAVTRSLHGSSPGGEEEEAFTLGRYDDYMVVTRLLHGRYAALASVIAGATAGSAEGTTMAVMLIAPGWATRQQSATLGHAAQNIPSSR